MPLSANHLPSRAEIDRCRQQLRQLQETLGHLNRETNLEQWSEEIGRCYRMVTDDIAVLDSFLATLHVVEALDPPSSPSDNG